MIWGTIFPDEPVPAQFAWYLAIDWFVDRVRACTNTLGDSYVTGIVDSLVAKSASSVVEQGGIGLSGIGKRTPTNTCTHNVA